MSPERVAVTFGCPASDCAAEFVAKWAEGDTIRCPECSRVWRTDFDPTGRVGTPWLDSEEPA